MAELLPTDRRVHELKTWPEFFCALVDGQKTFELRKDDRGFRVGDTLVLREYQPGAKEYTGRKLYRFVSYIMSGPAFGLMQNYVVMGLGVSADIRPHFAITSIMDLLCDRCGHGLGKHIGTQCPTDDVGGGA